MPLPNLTALRDFASRIALPQDLAAAVEAVTGRPPPPAAQERAAVDDALATVERCITWMDEETARLTESRFAQPDLNTMRQRLLQEPRRQIDQLLNALKQKVASERQEWARRLQKQYLDVNEQFARQSAGLRVDIEPRGHELYVRLHPEWQGSYARWLTEAFTRWAEHVETLVAPKALAAAEPELRALAQAIGSRPTSTPEVRPDGIRLETGLVDLARITATCEVTSFGEAIFESFKGGLNTVAMIAGLIVIPVVGSVMHTATMNVRAIVMGGMVVPVAVFAVRAGQKARRRIHAANLDKTRDKMRKELETSFKLAIERFRPEADRYVQAQLVAIQTAIVGALEPVIAQSFDEKERALAGDLAKAQLQAERTAEQLNTLRMAKGQLAGMLLSELRRRQHELAIGAPA
jgi:hypothetical protein